MTTPKPEKEAVFRAIRAIKEGKTPDEKCPYCQGPISITADPPGGPYTIFHFSCPCGKSSGFLRGI